MRLADIRRQNSYLEIEKKDLESVLREKEIELNFLRERMDKELERVIQGDTQLLRGCSLSYRQDKGS